MGHNEFEGGIKKFHAVQGTCGSTLAAEEAGVGE